MPAAIPPPPAAVRPPRAVVFDMDGVLISTEEVWDEVRRGLAADHGIAWDERHHRAMMGMSTGEWTAYMHREVGVPLAPERVLDAVVDRLVARYRAALPVLPGAVEAVRALGDRVPLGLASSSPAVLIDEALRLMGLRDHFAVVMSSEEVGVGKPAPDIYLAVLRRMGAAAGDAAAVEDSGAGIRAAHAAGMRVVAIPNPHYPPAGDDLALADVVLPDARALTPAVLGL